VKIWRCVNKRVVLGSSVH